MLKFILLGFILTVGVQSEFSDLKLLFDWNELEFEWPSEEVKAQAIANGSYIPENNAILGIEPYKNGRMFLTIPRWKLGVAASLVTVDRDDSNTSPIVRPYPDWEAHRFLREGELPQDNQIVSAHRIRIDKCDRLWVLDRGEENTAGTNPRQIRGPAIIIYDLKTNRQIRKYDVRRELYNTTTFYANLIIDDADMACGNAFAYIFDVLTYSMVVYSYARNDAWRFNNQYFYNDPSLCNFTISNVNFKWLDGIFGAALGPYNPRRRTRSLYFHPICSNYEYAVSTLSIQNKALATDTFRSDQLFQRIGYRGPNTESAVSDLDLPSGAMFFSMLNHNGFACWNIKKRLQPENVVMVAQNNEALTFTLATRLDRNRNLFVLALDLPTFLFGTLDRNRSNYRIYSAQVVDLLKSTPACTTLGVKGLFKLSDM